MQRLQEPCGASTWVSLTNSMLSVEFVVDPLTAPNIRIQKQRAFEYVYIWRSFVTRPHKLFVIIQQVVQCFHIFLRPFDNYSIFFLQLLLSFPSSSINSFSPISLLIPSAQVSLGLPRFLLSGGRHFITSLHKLFNWFLCISFCFPTLRCKYPKDTRILLQCHIDYADFHEFRLR